MQDKHHASEQNKTGGVVKLSSPIPSWGALVSWDVTAIHAKTGKFAGHQKSETATPLNIF
jgi:hypothetical protein